jgi:hypothetical protein
MNQSVSERTTYKFSIIVANINTVYLDQAVHYYTLGPKLGASPPTWHLVGLEVKVLFDCLLLRGKALTLAVWADDVGGTWTLSKI